MGLFDFLKKTTNEVIKNIENNVNQNEEVVYYNVDPNEELINYRKDKFNKEQVIALFLKSMNYRPHKIGKNNDDDYPRYLTYDYNILDVPSFHRELINNGYFCEASLKSIISNYKVNELKDLLLSKNQNIKGLKKDGLIDLVIETFDSQEKEKIIQESGLYELSEKGLAYLEEYKDFLTIVDFKKYSISYSLFMKYKNKLPEYATLRDVVWHIFNERLNYFSVHNEFGMFRGVYLYMAEFLEEEKPSIDVLYNYILCLYYDINFAYNQEQMLNKYLDNKDIINYLDNKSLAPGIITKIKEYSKYHDDKIFDKLFAYEKLPYKFISDNDFKEMIFDIYNSSFFDEVKYINVATANAKQIINKRKV